VSSPPPDSINRKLNGRKRSCNGSQGPINAVTGKWIRVSDNATYRESVRAFAQDSTFVDEDPTGALEIQTERKLTGAVAAVFGSLDVLHNAK
jgi:hypothetical protein